MSASNRATSLLDLGQHQEITSSPILFNLNVAKWLKVRVFFFDYVVLHYSGDISVLVKMQLRSNLPYTYSADTVGTKTECRLERGVHLWEVKDAVFECGSHHDKASAPGK